MENWFRLTHFRDYIYWYFFGAWLKCCVRNTAKIINSIKTHESLNTFSSGWRDEISFIFFCIYSNTVLYSQNLRLPLQRLPPQTVRVVRLRYID